MLLQHASYCDYPATGDSEHGHGARHLVHPEHKMLILCPAFLGLSVQTASLLGGEGQAAGQVQSLRCVASDLQRAPPSFANLVLGKTRTSGLLDCPNEDKQAALRAAAARMDPSKA